ncbi:MAG: hypothetical protein E7654_01195 [Ruminococcaceae bacterium]|nr:hypothetical protein [Oscillospiraceae bacterium]
MVKAKRSILLAFWIAVWGAALMLSAAGTDMPDLSTVMEEFRAALPEEVRAWLPPTVFGEEDSMPDGEAVAEMSSLPALLKAAGETLRNVLPSSAETLGEILLCLLFSALFRGVCAAFGEGKLEESALLCGRVGVALVLCGGQLAQLNLVRGALACLQGVANAMLPVLAALLAAGGNTASAAASGGGLLLFLNLAENLTAEFFLPLAAALCGLAAVVWLPERGRIRSLFGCLRRVLTFSLALFGTVFAAVFGAQTLLAAGADSISARTVKFAVGTAFPVIGGVIGDSVRTVAAGLGYLRDTVGLLGILLTLLPLAAPLLTLFLHRAVLLIGGAAAELLGCGEEQKMLEEYASVSGLLLAMVAGAAVCFIYVLIIFVRISLAVSG